ncbi:MAG: alpha/beta hydrolase [Myxococcota bacterium]|nr:alpha/beta hydrolase [Myxococcota bacterium]
MKRADPLSLFHQIQGSGPGIVLAHGFAGSSRNFRAQVRSLAEAHRVLTYDARGHARSPAPLEAAAYSMDLLVSDMGTLLEREGMSEPVVVGGLSMGAATALQFALAHPERVHALVLASYPPGKKDPGGISVRAEAFAEEIDEHGLDAAGARFIWGPDSGMAPAMAKQVRAGFLEHTPQGLSGVLRGVVAQISDPGELAARLARTRLPVLLVHGERDDPSGRAGRALSDENPMIETHVIPNAGHVVNLDQPKLFNEVLHSFLRRRPRVGGLS